MDGLFLVTGLALLLAGGEVLVRGGVALAQRLGLAPAVIGAVVLGFGTSTPELVTSLRAAAAGSPGIAIGNVVGSNIANILLILGLAVLVAPIDPRGAAPRADRVGLVVATLAALAVIVIGDAGRIVGLALLAALIVYLIVNIRAGLAASGPPVPVTDPGRPIWQGAGLALIGIAMTIAGAHFLVDAATAMARAAGVSEAVIGLTLVAVGTSLPELATGLVAAFRGQGALALGNVLGSNVFNIFGILGITALAVPMRVPGGIGVVDVLVLAGSALFLLGLIASGRIGRRAGAVMLVGYAGYVGWLAAGSLSA